MWMLNFPRPYRKQTNNNWRNQQASITCHLGNGGGWKLQSVHGRRAGSARRKVTEDWCTVEIHCQKKLGVNAFVGLTGDLYGDLGVGETAHPTGENDAGLGWIFGVRNSLEIEGIGADNWKGIRTVDGRDGHSNDWNGTQWRIKCPRGRGCITCRNSTSLSSMNIGRWDTRISTRTWKTSET